MDYIIGFISFILGGMLYLLNEIYKNKVEIKNLNFQVAQLLRKLLRDEDK